MISEDHISTEQAEVSVSKEEVVQHYHTLSPNGDKKIPELVEKLDVWKVRNLRDTDFKNAQFWYSDDLPKDHPDRLFTNNGQTRRLEDVASKWESVKQNLPNHQYIKNIEHFLDCYENNTPLPPAIMVEGRINKDSPHIIDGNTRMIAGAIYMSKTGETPNLKAYVGRKSFLQR